MKNHANGIEAVFLNKRKTCGGIPFCEISRPYFS
jgi:hypothetical protein